MKKPPKGIKNFNVKKRRKICENVEEIVYYNGKVVWYNHDTNIWMEYDPRTKTWKHIT